MIIKKVNWKYEIGQVISNDKANLTIIDREKREREIQCKGKSVVENRKYYKYLCNICGYDNGWKEETKISYQGCSCCAGHVAVDGINTVADKRPDLLVYFEDEREAHKYTVGSNHKVTLKCPTCGENREMDIHTLTSQKFVCNKCGNHISYPEKFIKSFLNQAGIEYIHQLSKAHFKWCDKYKYDFYLPDFNCIVEVNGSQHYNKCFTNRSAQTLEEVKQNDEYKKTLAENNGIKTYIYINCSKSNINIIKNGILKSGILEIANIDISKIDFVKCANDASRNLLKEVCDFYRTHSNMTPPEIAPIFNLNRATILDYLKKGTELGICEYDVNKAKIDSRIKGANKVANIKSVPVEIYRDGEYITTVKNSRLASEYIYNVYGIKILRSNIRMVCTGKYSHAKGFVFKDTKI